MLNQGVLTLILRSVLRPFNVARVATNRAWTGKWQFGEGVDGASAVPPVSNRTARAPQEGTFASAFTEAF